ncbi:MAG TPA: ATP-dependent protease LonB [Candidatus Thermoplasmatota archaeon]|nr:ATP-dependent protease LonB [Candidatus Thermoplasmatota archaeon]
MTEPEIEMSAPQDWVKREGIETTATVPVPTRLIDQVIGQDEAVRAAEKAARQQRHLMLIGDPGTGKSMIARAMAEILPPQKLGDVLVYPNPKDPNEPIVKEVDGGAGRSIVRETRRKARVRVWTIRTLEWAAVLGVLAFGLVFFVLNNDYMAALIALLVSLFFGMLVLQFRVKEENLVPKLLAEHSADPVPAPYVDATGSHAGALLGDVRHDPFQSGGLETPTHLRVEVGAIHRAHKGVLFIDEINVLRLDSQQALLTAMQDRRYSVVGQSERSSGAMVRTTPIPTDFILVAAGNMDAVRPTDRQYTGMHPALRSRIRGYGYEVYVNSIMDDTAGNRRKLVQFVAQEVRRDGKIPHFDASAVAEVVREAQRRAGRTGKLTLRLRELGGLVRTAGDVAREDGATLVTDDHVLRAKSISRSLEQQIIQRDLAAQREAVAPLVRGEAVGMAAGLGSVGTGEVGEPAGVVVPVEATVTPALSRSGGSIVASGALTGAGHASEALDNVGPLLKLLKGSAIADVDVHVQAHVRGDTVRLEGIGLAVAVAAVSAIDRLPVRQDHALAGLVAIQGGLRPVSAITQAIEAAAEAGFAAVVVPEGNRADVLLDPRVESRIEVVFANSLADALDRVLQGDAARRRAIVERVRRLGEPVSP